MKPVISQAAIDLIIAEEVSSEAVYRRRYTRPEWPGERSGVTIGIGYDVGYATRQQLWDDWRGHIPDRMIAAMERAIGITGPAAKPLTQSLRSVVDVPWDAAVAVFADSVLPRWIARVCGALPHTQELSPDSLGALVSLAYNRGASFSLKEQRYAEMRAIKAHMAARNFDAIPDEFRSMKRLWPASRGLRDRRDREAMLFARGLVAARPEPGTPKPGTIPKPVPKPAPMPAPVPRPPDIEPVPPKPAEPELGSKMWGWLKSWKTWATGGGLGLAGGVADWRIWLIAGVIFIVAGGVVWFTFVLPKLRERRSR